MTSRLLGPAMVVTLLVIVACVVVFSTNSETDAVLRESATTNYFSLLEDDQDEGNAAKSRSHLTKGAVEAAKKEASTATDEAAKSAETVKALRSQVNKFPSIVRHAAKTSAEDSASVVKAAADVMFKRKIKKEERRIVVAQRKTAHYERVARADLTVAAKEKADAQKALHIAASLTLAKRIKKSALVQLASAGCQTKDLRDGCSQWGDKCRSSRWAAYMAKNCAVTCKVACQHLGLSPTQEALRAADVLESLDGPRPAENDDLENVSFKSVETLHRSVVRDEGKQADAAGETAYKTARYHSEVIEKHTLKKHVDNIPQDNLKQTKAVTKAALKKAAAVKAVAKKAAKKAAKAMAKAAGKYTPKKKGYYVPLKKNGAPKKKKAAKKPAAKKKKKKAKAAK